MGLFGNDSKPRQGGGGGGLGDQIAGQVLGKGCIWLLQVIALVLFALIMFALAGCAPQGPSGPDYADPEVVQTLRQALDIDTQALDAAYLEGKDLGEQASRLVGGYRGELLFRADPNSPEAHNFREVQNWRPVSSDDLKAIKVNIAEAKKILNKSAVTEGQAKEATNHILQVEAGIAQIREHNRRGRILLGRIK